MSRLRRTTTPSSNDRGSRHISLRSSNVPYAEYDLISSLDRIQELMRVLDRLLPSPEVLRTRSEKDRKRFELLGSVIDRLRIVEADMRTILSEGGLDKESLQNICGDETCLQLATRPCDAGVG
ncbi:unnamed protein product [Anisakis simplex]|uniref:BAG domain-containing protein n=1 Tax=Anisakis simplex TaxID=6269 RepID=A0A0M3JLV8_ANISI|nr:unnamed protein product [Anisakis simplex]